MVVKNREKAENKPVKLAKATLSPIQLAKATLSPIQAEIYGDMRINIAAAADFHKLLGNEVLFVTSKGDLFFFHRNGALYTTQSFNLKWNKFHRLSVKDFSGLQGVLHFNNTYEKDFSNFASKAWADKEKAVCERRGGHPLLSEQWCAASDFSSREFLEDAVATGYLTQRDMMSARDEGFDNGAVYYFAKAFGFRNSNDAKRALSLGINQTTMYSFLKKGRFDDLKTATQAQKRGFTNKKQWDEAVVMGCSSPAELKALKKDGWPTLQAYHAAMKLGFKDTESKLHSRLSETQCFQHIWRSIQQNPTQTFKVGDPKILGIIRANPKVLKEMEVSKVDQFWQASVLLKLRASALGSLMDLISLERDAQVNQLKCEEMNGDIFREFIYHHPAVHRFGTAITADGVFHCREKNA